MGNYTTTKGAKAKDQDGFDETKTVTFWKPFERTPKVIASISGFKRYQQFSESSKDPWWGLTVKQRNVSTSSFDLYLQGFSTKVETLTATWIACE